MDEIIIKVNNLSKNFGSVQAVKNITANHHLRQSLVFLNVPTMQQPEAYIGNADKLFDGNGNLTNDSTREFITKFMQAFAAWVVRNALN